MLYKICKLSCGFYYIRIGLSTAAAGIACGDLAVPDFAFYPVKVYILKYREAVGCIPNVFPIKIRHISFGYLAFHIFKRAN